MSVPTYNGDTTQTWQSTTGTNLVFINRNDIIVYPLIPMVVGQDPDNVTTVMAVQNYPNPFNSATWIELKIPYPGIGFIAVYDLMGRTVIEQQIKFSATGTCQWRWDGLDQAGAPVSSGVYI